MKEENNLSDFVIKFQRDGRASRDFDSPHSAQVLGRHQANESVHQSVQDCSGESRNSTFPARGNINQTRFSLQKLACSPEVCKDDMKHTLEVAMKRNGLETEIRNIVFHLIRTSIKNEVKLTMQTVRVVKFSSLL